MRNTAAFYHFILNVWSGKHKTLLVWEILVIVPVKFILVIPVMLIAHIWWILYMVEIQVFLYVHVSVQIIMSSLLYKRYIFKWLVFFMTIWYNKKYTWVINIFNLEPFQDPWKHQRISSISAEWIHISFSII